MRSSSARARSRAGRDGFEPRAAVERWDDSLADASEGASSSGSLFGRISGKVAQARKARFKEKADKRFDSQYGALDDAPASGPRAAVYRGQMGSQHKRAARTLEGSPRRGGSQDAGPSDKRKRSLPLPLAVAGCAVAGIALVGIVLYGPAQQFYQELRENDRLEAEYQAVSDRNDNIRSEVNSLSTADGVQDRAREEFGMVLEGETAGSVIGIDIPEEPSSFTGNVVSSDVKPPDTWYSFLDPIFGVE